MHVQLAENLSSVQEVGVVDDLVDVVGNEGQVEDERNPVAVDKEEESQEAVDCGLWNDVCV